jgi:hypothetical protein
MFEGPNNYFPKAFKPSHPSCNFKNALSLDSHCKTTFVLKNTPQGRGGWTPGPWQELDGTMPHHLCMIVLCTLHVETSSLKTPHLVCHDILVRSYAPLFL